MASVQNTGPSFESFIKYSLNGEFDEIKKVLADERFDINKADYHGNTVLHHAAATDNFLLVKMLLNHGRININAKNPNGSITPAMVASRNGSAKTLELLLNSGANTSFQNDFGNTALMIAVNSNQIECIKVILKHGNYNIKAQDCDFGYNALMLSIKNLLPLEIIEGLLQHSDLSQTDEQSYTALHVAGIYGSEIIIRMLIEAGMDVDSVNDSGNTPLHCAIIAGRFPIAEVLIKNGSSLSTRYKNSSNAFELAAEYDFNGIFFKKHKCPESELLSTIRVACHCGNLNYIKHSITEVQDVIELRNFIIESTVNDQLDCLKYLVSLNVHDENAIIRAAFSSLANRSIACFDFIHELYTNSFGFSDVIKRHYQEFAGICCLNGLNDYARFFLAQENEVDPNGIDSETYLMVASGNNNFELTKELLKHPKVEIDRCHERFGPALLLATTNGHCKIVEILLDAGADPKLGDENGFNPLLSAAYQGHFDIFNLICKYCNSDAFLSESKDGTNLLLASAHSGNVNMIKAALKLISNHDKCDSYGENCFHAAAYSAKNIDAFIFLISAVPTHKALLEAPNVDGKSPLDLLISHQNQEILYSLFASCPGIEDYFITGSKFIFDGGHGYDMCLICREEYLVNESLEKLPCGHVFHHQCFFSWAVSNSTCPYCKRFPFRIKKNQSIIN